VGADPSAAVAAFRLGAMIGCGKGWLVLLPPPLLQERRHPSL
jgi:hypothetical protein